MRSSSSRHQSEVEVPSSPEQPAEEQPSEEKAPLSPSIAALKPAVNHIKDEKSAKIHIIDTIIYDMQCKFLRTMFNLPWAVRVGR